MTHENATQRPWEVVRMSDLPFDARYPDPNPETRLRVQSVELSTPEKAVNVAYLARSDGKSPAEIIANAALIVEAVNVYDHGAEAATILRKLFSLEEFGRQYISCHVGITEAYDTGPQTELDPEDEAELVAWFNRDQEIRDA